MKEKYWHIKKFLCRQKYLLITLVLNLFEEGILEAKLILEIDPDLDDQLTDGFRPDLNQKFEN